MYILEDCVLYADIIFPLHSTKAFSRTFYRNLFIYFIKGFVIDNSMFYMSNDMY